MVKAMLLAGGINCRKSLLLTLVAGDCSTVAGTMAWCSGVPAWVANTTCGAGLGVVNVCLLALGNTAEPLAWQFIAVTSAAGLGHGCEAAPAAQFAQ